MSFQFKQHLSSAFQKRSVELGTGNKEMNSRDPGPTVMSLSGTEVPMGSHRELTNLVSRVPMTVTNCPSLPRTEGVLGTWG